MVTEGIAISFENGLIRAGLAVDGPYDSSTCSHARILYAG